MPEPFKRTSAQVAACRLMSGPAKHILLVGGSRSGKTMEALHMTTIRAIAAPASRHLVTRLRFNHCKASVVLDTLPKMMALCYPDLDYDIDKTDWYMRLSNDSQVWFGGLDDKERTEKILGQEYATVFFNECSQIPLSSRDLALTRLAQKCTAVIGGERREMRLKAYYDCNPPSKAHWTYKIFVRLIDPTSGRPLAEPERYAHMFMNPHDNLENLPADYIRELSLMSPRTRARFLEGKFAELTAGALWSDELIEQHRYLQETPELIRVLVSVDPSGSGDDDNISNDEIGIVVIGLGIDGRAYVLEDCTCKAGPATWGNVVVQAWARHDADIVVAEKNYGGAMVEHVIRTARLAANVEGVRVKLVNASRGKTVRAEPIAALTEQGKIRFAGVFTELESELGGFTTHGYVGEDSPNRADAFVWGCTELFPGLTRRERQVAPIIKEWAPSDAAMGY